MINTSVHLRPKLAPERLSRPLAFTSWLSAYVFQRICILHLQSKPSLTHVLHPFIYNSARERLSALPGPIQALFITSARAALATRSVEIEYVCYIHTCSRARTDA